MGSAQPAAVVIQSAAAVTPTVTAPPVCSDQKPATSSLTVSTTSASAVPSGTPPCGATMATVTWLVTEPAGTVAAGRAARTTCVSSTSRAGA
ncbi:hypothetical protein [Geodermatophilus normandii]|uniref:hypothetical protein n=1 Tax=Geodermatophilus normandii TaxID=1137989 RepID=UPI001FE49AD1|nr:hypothetical protein [Geodermatophilus normandii]